MVGVGGSSPLRRTILQTANNLNCAFSSAWLEHHLDMVGVGGSSPLRRTILQTANNLNCAFSSAWLEHHLDMVGVGGSSPLRRTTYKDAEASFSVFTPLSERRLRNLSSHKYHCTVFQLRERSKLLRLCITLRVFHGLVKFTLYSTCRTISKT